MHHCALNCHSYAAKVSGALTVRAKGQLMVAHHVNAAVADVEESKLPLELLLLLLPLPLL